MMLDVRVIPNAGRTGITGMREGAVVVRVSAPAIDGKANRAAVDCLARLFEVPRARVRLVSGEKSRHKKIEIIGLEAGQLQAKLADLLGGSS